MDLDEARSLRSQCVAGLLTEFGLVDLVRHFRQRRRLLYLNTLTQVRQGAILCSRCNYILGMDRCRFELVGIRDMCNYMSDYFAIQARLLRCPTRWHACYLQGRREFPLKPPPSRNSEGLT